MNTVTLYSVRFRRSRLQRWARHIPRELGAALVSGAFQTLLRSGDAGELKSLGFVGHVNARRRRRNDAAARGSSPIAGPGPAR